MTEPTRDGAQGSSALAGALAWRTKSLYSGTMRAVGRGLERAHVLEGVPDRDDRLRHWTTSLFRVHDSLAISDLDVPWWTYRAIDVVDAWLSARPRPIRVFEYGAGASTIWLARRVDEVVSIEHHAGFADTIGPVLAELPNVDFRLVEPTASATPAIGSSKPGNAGLDFSDYVHAIDSTEGTFDLVVVDGRAREACLRQSLPRLADDGLLVLDNSHRRRYRDALDETGLPYRRLRGLTPSLPYPDETSLLSRR